MAHIVPPIALLLAKHPSVDQYNVSSLKVIFSGAAPLSRACRTPVYIAQPFRSLTSYLLTAGEVEEQLRQRLRGIRIMQGYGMTEMSPLSHVCRFDDDRAPPGSIGQLSPSI